MEKALTLKTANVPTLDFPSLLPTTLCTKKLNCTRSPSISSTKKLPTACLQERRGEVLLWEAGMLNHLSTRQAPQLTRQFTQLLTPLRCTQLRIRTQYQLPMLPKVDTVIVILLHRLLKPHQVPQHTQRLMLLNLPTWLLRHPMSLLSTTLRHAQVCTGGCKPRVHLCMYMIARILILFSSPASWAFSFYSAASPA